MKLNTKNISLIQLGFSLIELLVVIAIIGILAGIGIIGYDSYVEYTRRAANEANARIIANTLNAERVKPNYCTRQTSTAINNNVQIINLFSTPEYIGCVTRILAANNIINPYTNLPYGSGFNLNNQIEEWLIHVSPGPNTVQWSMYDDYSSTLMSGACSDDAGGLVMITGWSNDNIYIATCKNTLDPWGDPFPVYKMFDLK
jgi:prepilin-type N-terminal cleavage/methylation domain-containing protein